MTEKLGEISENNATIAENQQKVYDAGVRAGKSEDVDYASGYTDGYEVGRDSALGGSWEALISGKTAVGRAIEADHANEADHASTANSAETATNAENANHANRADNATEAEYATNADHATEADHATSSDTSDYATNAGHAEEADRATNAGHATTATTATTASKAMSVEGVLPMENGGTGAANAEDARENLGLGMCGFVETGTYVGDGGYNYQRPTSITFKKKPEIIFFFNVLKPNTTNLDYRQATYYAEANRFIVDGRLGVNGAEDRRHLNSTLTENADGTYTLSWYNSTNSTDDAALNQMNQKDETYKFIAISAS